PCVAGLCYEDLYQEGCVWLCNAALTFDPARGNFASYARRVVQNGLIGYCRNVLSKYQHTVLLGDLEPAVLTALEVQNAISSHTKCETPLLLVAAESQYGGVTRKGIHALALQVSGIPLTAVATRMSAPPNHVSAWISRAVCKLRNNESFLSSLHEN
ncbi:MAG: sigma factor, partial [Merdibacter sp.]